MDKKKPFSHKIKPHKGFKLREVKEKKERKVFSPLLIFESNYSKNAVVVVTTADATAAVDDEQHDEVLNIFPSTKLVHTLLRIF